MSIKKVHNAHIRALLPELHRSLIDITVIMNQPERDVELLAKAGLSLERALFPLLVLIERFGPIGVVDLAGRVGRDYTTVSRQVARLEELGLVTRRAGSTDKRIREALVTAAGKEATGALDAAREEMAIGMFADWERKDFDDLVRLMRKLVEAMY
ncbi:DNA-binding MarR family transcriptional regulator [Sphingopyxis panaciterrae]|uniref:MarR family winged helix-turn-helix transcriptional regulator n=1 Tax=Sphingopyxis panaciterrae TaxID=363841 RepID=UPI00141DDC31|nr:MarR family winged helix-turn-helix transcriptional regulator [Sphingopyxis panaciterrae]NIJ37572.1 DNA-binding MarR family transcriptional regulator [Sphingopyxis panaciterrae]